ncbi:MAG: DEAD/DEAH box helicase family protein [Dehalococcoidia bacterium]|nr:DEAD/DEAH box helicase family protein [Dehalococcoidia bacterium]
MSSQTQEQAFEATVQSMLLDGGWRAGDPDKWDKWDVDRALFPARIVAFLRETQPKEWGQVEALHGANLETMIVDALVKEMDLKGSLGVLRHGFKFYGKTFRLAYFKPAHGLNPDALAQYERNTLTVTRQARCHPGKGDELDLLFALNGVPVATCELKNPWTNRTWRHAVHQYRVERDPRAPLFRFQKRALVHFAADPDEVHMTTRLAGESTRFLPFNRGSHPGEVQCGAGNPSHPSGYRTGYFWQEVLERERFLDILGHYVFVERTEKKVNLPDGTSRTDKKEAVIFPRYHQLDSVHRIVETARLEGSGRNYLVQHSAGSGKTNSISWLSHRLASLHTAEDGKVFDCVVVITDRRVLDQQLQDAIYQIEHAQGVVKAIDQDSKQLAEALIDGTKIVITTLQKFPFVLKGLLRAAGTEDLENPSADDLAKQAEWREAIADRTYAVIVDEAHSSQTGETAREMKAILGSPDRDEEASGSEEQPADWEDGLNAVLESRGRQSNLSFFAFTATPKGKTLELFGRKGPSGKDEAFHVYSMRQAIEEGFILDVLQNYTTYKTFFRLVKMAEEDPNFPKRRTATALSKFMSLHPVNIDQKTEVILEHFRNNVQHRMGRKAKAMVVCASRLHAVRYKQAFDAYLEANGITDIRALVAFSGTVRDPDTAEEFTEPGMNTDCITGKPISEAALPSRFDSPDYQVLIVANKYQTGFDQPLLHTMYVDKRLDGVQAVQTLSRLNRTAPGKDAPFVLDFVNDAENIHRAFKPYYDKTELLEQSDPSRLEALKHELDQMQVYHWSEVEAFAKVFYVAPEKQRASDHPRLARHLQPARDRFKPLEPDQQEAFRDRLSAFVKMYAFLSQIIPYGDHDLERLYSFGRLLLPSIQPDREDNAIHLGDGVDLEYYRLERIQTGPIQVSEGPVEYVTSPGELGTGRVEEERAPLSEIIEILNDRFGTHFTEEDRLFFEQVKERAIRDERVQRTGKANTYDRFALGIRALIETMMLDRMTENDGIVTRYIGDRDFQDAAFPVLAREIFDRVRDEGAASDDRRERDQ